MRYRKAPGPSGLKPDTIKALAQEIICENDEIDQDEDKNLSNSFITTIHKYLLNFWNRNNETVIEE